MWKIAKSLVTLADDLQRYHGEIKEIRKELRDLTLIVHALAQDNKHSKDTAATEREKLLLEVENRFLKMERILPQAQLSENDGDAEEETSKQGNKKKGVKK